MNDIKREISSYKRNISTFIITAKTFRKLQNANKTKYECNDDNTNTSRYKKYENCLLLYFDKRVV